MVGKIYLNKWIKYEIIWTKIALASHGHDRNYPNVGRSDYGCFIDPDFLIKYFFLFFGEDYASTNFFLSERGGGIMLNFKKVAKWHFALKLV